MAKAEQQYKQQIIDKEFKGFDDPTQNVNYVPPAQQQSGVYGFSGQGHAPDTPEIKPPPDPRFPTSDSITGRVTPAAQPVTQIAAPVQETQAQPNTEFNFEDLQKLPKKTQLEILDKFHGQDQEEED